MSKNNENKKSNQKTTMKKVLKRIKPYSFLVICSLVMAAAAVALTLYFPLLTGDAIDYILEPGKVDFNAIIPILKKLAVIAIITAVCQWIMNVCNDHITYNVTKDIRDEAFKKIEILPLRYIDDHSYGDIVSRVIADVDQFADGLLMGFTQLFTGVLTILGTLIFMFRENVTITFGCTSRYTGFSFCCGFYRKENLSLFQTSVRNKRRRNSSYR